MIEMGPLGARLLRKSDAPLVQLANGFPGMNVLNSPTVVNSDWGAKVLVYEQFSTPLRMLTSLINWERSCCLENIGRCHLYKQSLWSIPMYIFYFYILSVLSVKYHLLIFIIL